MKIIKDHYSKSRISKRPANWGFLGLSASFPYINFALLKLRNYDKIQVQTAAFLRGKKSGLMHVVAEWGGGKRTPFCRRMVIKPGSVHRDNMQESQDNTADLVGLMNQVIGSAVFLLMGERTPPRMMPFPLKIGCTAQDAVISSLFPEEIERKQ